MPVFIQPTADTDRQRERGEAGKRRVRGDGAMVSQPVMLRASLLPTVSSAEPTLLAPTAVITITEINR